MGNQTVKLLNWIIQQCQKVEKIIVVPLSLLLMWTCGKNSGWISAVDFSTNPHCALAKSKGAFFLYHSERSRRTGGCSVGKKVFFCGWKDSGKRLAKSGGSGVFCKNEA
jgi:hypothetical protein